MNISREDFCWMTFNDFCKDLIQQQCLESIRSTFGNEAPSGKTVCYGFAEFRRGRASVGDEFHEGRPKQVIFTKNIDALRN